MGGFPAVTEGPLLALTSREAKLNAHRKRAETASPQLYLYAQLHEASEGRAVGAD